MINVEHFGRGLADVIDLQRQVNELDRLMARQIRLSAAEDPFERIRHFNETREELQKRVDELREG